MMSKEEIEAEANEWIRSQGWSEETLPSDELGQMLEAFAAGFKTANGKISCSLTEKNEYCSVAYNTENNDLWDLILQIGTYNGTACYDSYEDMLTDEKSGQGVSLTAAEVRRLIFTAYKMGKAERND